MAGRQRWGWTGGEYFVSREENFLFFFFIIVRSYNGLMLCINHRLHRSGIHLATVGDKKLFVEHIPLSIVRRVHWKRSIDSIFIGIRNISRWVWCFLYRFCSVIYFVLLLEIFVFPKCWRIWDAILFYWWLFR